MHFGYWGKSMNNPDNATFVFPHRSNGNYVVLKENFISHFRNRYNLNKIEVPITSIGIDINYFLCYYLPIFEKLTKHL